MTSFRIFHPKKRTTFWISWAVQTFIVHSIFISDYMYTYSQISHLCKFFKWRPSSYMFTVCNCILFVVLSDRSKSSICWHFFKMLWEKWLNNRLDVKTASQGFQLYYILYTTMVLFKIIPFQALCNPHTSNWNYY